MDQVDKQSAHFFGVTINEQQAESGLVVRVTSTAQSKFKVFFFSISVVLPLFRFEDFNLCVLSQSMFFFSNVIIVLNITPL